jgi:hypothetical protein
MITYNSQREYSTTKWGGGGKRNDGIKTIKSDSK